MSEDTVQRLMALHDRAADLYVEYCDDDANGDTEACERSRMDMHQSRSTLESALREALMPAGWKPIETAPESGEFLVYMPDEPVGRKIQAAKWRPNVKVIGGNFAFDLTKPTHWMPLPAAPAFPVELEQPESLGVSPDGAGLSGRKLPSIPDAAREVPGVTADVVAAALLLKEWAEARNEPIGWHIAGIGRVK